MADIDPEAARAFASRWRLAAAAEREELMRTTLAQKLAQLSSLMESARALDWKTTDPREVEEVRARWNRLATIYRG